MARNFAALWPTDSKFSATKDLNLLKKHIKNQVASSILKVVFSFSKWPHLHRAYVISGCIFFATAVFPVIQSCWFFLPSARKEICVARMFLALGQKWETIITHRKVAKNWLILNNCSIIFQGFLVVYCHFIGRLGSIQQLPGTPLW